jgi:serine/threonine-protein kinase
VVVLFAIFSRASDLIPSLEPSAFDLGVAATTRTPSDRIGVIAIDDASLENIGRWPWSRDVIATVIERPPRRKPR